MSLSVRGGRKRVDEQECMGCKQVKPIITFTANGMEYDLCTECFNKQEGR